jgi:hypothetical protein
MRDKHDQDTLALDVDAKQPVDLKFTKQTDYALIEQLRRAGFKIFRQGRQVSLDGRILSLRELRTYAAQAKPTSPNGKSVPHRTRLNPSEPPSRASYSSPD